MKLGLGEDFGFTPLSRKIDVNAVVTLVDPRASIYSQPTSSHADLHRCQTSACLVSGFLDGSPA
jgi:hypothetical protein